jgi:ApbE superfamily uncharacterized protein (UPF0280 family)
MARRGHRDPTAEKAIANADKARKASPRRKLVQEFPEIFDDLSDRGVAVVAYGAVALAGGSPWAVTLAHLEKARAEYGAQK